MRTRVLIPSLLVLALLAACGGDGEPAPEPTSTPARTATPTPGPTATALPTATLAPPPPTRPPPAIQPPLGGSASVISRGDTTRRAVTLTFDAGSDAGYTSQILDTLSANGIVAGFGITGRWAEQNPELLRRIVREGHELINHTYNHGSFTGLSTGEPPLSQAQRWDQLDRTEGIVQSLTGASTLPYFRPPYGDQDASVNRDVLARGYRYNVMWTVDSYGWRGVSTDEIVARCLQLAAPGAIYIFHVGSASGDGPALQRVIDGLRAAGYSFVPLSSIAPG
ncbi:MAG: polysaccharide deacetylase family protein [Dehalococcoidia bacterium]